MRIQATVEDTKVRKRLRSVPALVKAHARRRLSYWGRYIIKSIKRDRALFKYKDGVNNRPGEPHLINSLWTERDKGSRQPAQLCGWGVPWGEVLEFGPRQKKSWMIRPKGFRSDVSHGRSGASQALKFLRFEVAGEIKYAREVEHVWDDDQKREHFGPHLEKHDRGMKQDLGSIPARVIAGKLR